VYILFSGSNESKSLKHLENLAIDAASLIRQWSSSQLIKETTASVKVGDNHNLELQLFTQPLFFIDPLFFP
jgi:hypothetical protein